MILSSKTVSVIHKSIHVEKLDDNKFTVYVYTNGKIDAVYDYGTREWADKLAKRLSDNDCPHCQRNGALEPIASTDEAKQVSATM